MPHRSNEYSIIKSPRLVPKEQAKHRGALEQNCGWLSRVELAARAISSSITPGSGLGRDGGGISQGAELLPHRVHHPKLIPPCICGSSARMRARFQAAVVMRSR